ncbi:MAG TPA: NlpC/P60 family protein [Candidatus Angelobacter sp.]
MRRSPTPTALILFVSFILCGTAKLVMAQDEIRPSFTKFSTSIDSPDLSRNQPDSKSLLLMIGQQIHETELDCSHFVQYLYEQAGLYYGYAPSKTLYEGMDGFKRVAHPKPGDLIVWRGHVGVVVDPDETTFLSALRSGVKVSSYQSHYWQRRGKPHFLRYVGTNDGDAPEWAARRPIASRSGSTGE